MHPVHRDEAHAGFDESCRQQKRLAVNMPAVALAATHIFLFQVERPPGFGRRQQAKCPLSHGVESAQIASRLQRVIALFNRIQQAPPTRAASRRGVILGKLFGLF